MSSKLKIIAAFLIGCLMALVPQVAFSDQLADLEAQLRVNPSLRNDRNFQTRLRAAQAERRRTVARAEEAARRQTQAEREAVQRQADRVIANLPVQAFQLFTDRTDTRETMMFGPRPAPATGTPPTAPRPPVTLTDVPTVPAELQPVGAAFVRASMAPGPVPRGAPSGATVGLPATAPQPRPQPSNLETALAFYNSSRDNVTTYQGFTQQVLARMPAVGSPPPTPSATGDRFTASGVDVDNNTLGAFITAFPRVPSSVIAPESITGSIEALKRLVMRGDVLGPTAPDGGPAAGTAGGHNARRTLPDVPLTDGNRLLTEREIVERFLKGADAAQVFTSAVVKDASDLSQKVQADTEAAKRDLQNKLAGLDPDKAARDAAARAANNAANEPTQSPPTDPLANNGGGGGSGGGGAGGGKGGGGDGKTPGGNVPFDLNIAGLNIPQTPADSQNLGELFPNAYRVSGDQGSSAANLDLNPMKFNVPELASANNFSFANTNGKGGPILNPGVESVANLMSGAGSAGSVMNGPPNNPAAPGGGDNANNGQPGLGGVPKAGGDNLSAGVFEGLEPKYENSDQPLKEVAMGWGSNGAEGGNEGGDASINKAAKEGDGIPPALAMQLGAPPPKDGVPAGAKYPEAMKTVLFYRGWLQREGCQPDRAFRPGICANVKTIARATASLGGPELVAAARANNYSSSRRSVRAGSRSSLPRK